jgi:hypothetical protein
VAQGTTRTEGPREAAIEGTKEEHEQADGLTVWKINMNEGVAAIEVESVMDSSPASSTTMWDSSFTGSQSTRSRDAKEEGRMLGCLELAMI